MTDEQAVSEKVKRFRSPSYPTLDLQKAVGRIEKLYSKAQQHEVGVNVLLDAWEMESVTGRVWRIAAALIQYGLLSDSGTGKTRKFKVSDSARRIVHDHDPNSVRRSEAIKKAALLPMIHGELWNKYGTTTGLSEAILKNFLTIDRLERGEAPYSDGAANEVLQTYKATISYSGLMNSATLSEPVDGKNPNDRPTHNSVTECHVQVGDLVKWTSGGVDQFSARKVEKISPDASHLWVIGSSTGIPMEEIEKVSEDVGLGPSAHDVFEGEEAPVDAEVQRSDANKHSKLKKVTTSVIGNRLQISADVSVDEIASLKEMLTKYEGILRMMN